MKIFALLFFSLLFSTCIVSAQWSAAIKLSPNAKAASLNENMGPCLATSGDTVHVVWCDHRTSGSSIYYKRSLDAGQTWNTEVAITDTNGRASFPAIAVSGSSVHIVWFDSLAGQSCSFYKHSLDNGNTWSTNYCLDSITKFWPGVAASGNLVVVSLNKQVVVGNTEVFFRRSLDNGANWDTIKQISNANGRSEDPAISALGSDVHLSWNDNRSGTMEIYYRHSRDAGVTWGPETDLISAVPNMAYTTMVSLDGPNVDVPCGIRNGHYDIFMRQSSDTGGNWGSVNQLTNTPSTDEVYPFLVRSGLNMHLGYVQFTTGPWYLHSGDGGLTWDTAFAIGKGSNPFLGVTGCAVHIIWPDSGKIFYRQNPTGNPGNCNIATSISTPSHQQNGLIYPNPNDGHFIFGNNLSQQPALLRITDMTGRIIYQQSISNEKENINASNLPDGIYLWEITGLNKPVNKGKLAIIH